MRGERKHYLESALENPPRGLLTKLWPLRQCYVIINSHSGYTTVLKGVNGDGGSDRDGGGDRINPSTESGTTLVF